MTAEARFWVLIPAAGSGVRMGSSIPKQYLALLRRAVIEHVLDLFLAAEKISGITVAVSSSDPYWQRYGGRNYSKPVLTVNGGEERVHSVRNALASLQQELKADDWVLVHDAVRPCLHPADLDHLLATLEHDEVGGILAAPAVDTIKQVNDMNYITDTPSRGGLWHALTPQMFRYGLLCEALDRALAAGELPTDESSAVEKLRPGRVRVVEGRGDNLKITRPDDVSMAEAILQRRAEGRA